MTEDQIKQSEERRRHHRFDSDVHIMTNDKGSLLFAFIRDLSHGGAFIESKKLVAVGEPFMFTLSTGKHQATITSRVIRHKYCSRNLRPIGFAVEFDEPKGESKFVRDDLLLYAMTKKYLEVWDQPIAQNNS
ncbi:MAG: PilZ domain-containing protein [Bdellovibrionales bacterium]|nr:PilZ domain-containing protein [Bdellovibrionales bacterium]